MYNDQTLFYDLIQNSGIRKMVPPINGNCTTFKDYYKNCTLLPLCREQVVRDSHVQPCKKCNCSFLAWPSVINFAMFNHPRYSVDLVANTLVVVL